MINFSVTSIPKVNMNWLQQSTKDITRVVEEENRAYWAQEKSPKTENKWIPRKQPTGNWPILNKTGNMFKKTKFSPESKGSMSITFPFYGKFHLEKRPWLGAPKTTEKKIAEIITSKIFL